MKEITKYQSVELSKVNCQVQIHNTLLAEIDIYNELLNIDLIKHATELAITSRLYLDPFYDRNEIDDASLNNIAQKVHSRIIDGNFDTVELFKVSFPKNKFEHREFSYYDITSYTIRFLFALIIFRKYAINEKVFGGQNDIFDKYNSFTDVYQKHKEDFGNWQKDMIRSNSYKWIYIADINKYYKSISTETLADQLINNLGINSVKFLDAFRKTYTEITIGSWCDHFVQNLYLKGIDNSLSKLNGISYARFTDDFRVFCKEEKDCEIVHNVITNELSKLGLNFNKEKRFVIQELRVNKDKEFDFSIKTSNSYYKNVYSHYIKIDEIANHCIENLARVKTNSSEPFFEFIPKYEQVKLPKKITYKNDIDGKSGFTINNIDIYTFLEELESNNQNIDLKVLDDLAKIIEFSYGSYAFYFRVIKLFLNIITQDRGVNGDVLVGVSKKLFSSIGFSSFEQLKECLHSRVSFYKAYVLIRVMFSMDNRNKTFFNTLTRYKPIKISVVGLFSNIILTGPNYLTSEIFYHLKQDYTDSLKLKSGIKFCYSVYYWKQLLSLFDDSEYFFVEKKEHKLRFINNLYELLPNSTEIRLLHADTLKNVKEYNKALDIYTSIEQQGHSVSDFDLAFCYAEVGNREKALFRYTKELEIKKSGAAFNNRSLLYQEFNNLEKALEDLNNAISMESEELYYLNRAKLQVKIGDLQSAIEDIESAFQLEKNTELIKYKAQILAQYRKTELAIVEIEKYCDLKGWISEDVRKREINEIRDEKPKPIN